MRIGILVDGDTQEGWTLVAARQALDLPGVSLAAVARVDDRPAGTTERLHGRFLRATESSRVRDDGFFAPVDLAATLGVAPIRVAIERGDTGWRLGEAGTQALHRCGADVWLCLTGDPPARPFPRVSRRGVLGLVIGHDVPAGSEWAGAAEAAAACPVTMVSLVDFAEAGEAVRYRSFGATLESASRNRLRALRKGVSFPRRLLQAWTRDGDRDVPVAPATLDVPAGYPSIAAPTLPAIAALGRRAVRARLRGVVPSVRWTSQWQIGYAFSDGPPLPVRTDRLRYLVPPRDRFWADPMALEHDGRHVILFEELPYRTQKGHLAAIEVAAEGEPGPARRVLERPYHLSYPFVFTWEGTLYMLPETAGNRTVELYACESFPDRWRLDRVLLEGLSAFDTTLWREADRWWMFVNVAEPGADAHDELHLYWASTPLGPWTAHPRNPVVSDVRCARGAGPLFVHDGMRYRPSQDCSLAYGHSVLINRIDVLTEHDYRETVEARLLPGWRRDILRVHTLGTGGPLTVVDCMVRRKKRW